MAFPRVTFFISDGKFQWTETYYNLLAGITLDNLLLEGKNLATLRCPLMATWLPGTDLTKGVSLDEIRVSMDDTWRDSLIDTSFQRSKNPGAYPKINGAASRPERPYSSLLLRADMSEGGNKGYYRRDFFMSGIPDNIINDPGGPDTFALPAFGLSMNLFIQELTNNPQTWGTKVRTKGLASPEFNIVGINFNLAANTALIGVNGSNFLQFDATGNQNYLLIRNCRFVAPQYQPNGMRAFSVGAAPVPPMPGATAYYLIPNITESGVYTGKGKVRLLNYQIRAFDDIVVVGETHRKRGVRTGQPLGRSLKKHIGGL